LEHADPIEKISIVSRGMALGVTWMMPEEDKYLYSKAKFLDEMVTLLGGRAIEEIVFGKEHITTGASNDLERVTKLATDMVTKYGMDEEIGLVQYKQAEAGEMDMYRPYAEQTAQQIDLKIRALVSSSYERSKQLLTQHLELIHTMAKVLLEKEYLTKEEFEELVIHPEHGEAMITQAIAHKKEEAKIEKADDIQVIEKRSPKTSRKAKKT
jgi:cell division protease FtsH